MNLQAHSQVGRRDLSGSLGSVAALFVILFNADLLLVSSFGVELGIKPPFFPGPTAPADQVVSYFQTHTMPVLVSSFLQFGAAMTLGGFSASVVRRLRVLGVRTAAPEVALFGGLATAFNMSASAGVLWVIVYPDIVSNTSLIPAFHALSFVFGGPGFSVPMALLVAGVSISAGSMKLLSKWVVRLGLAIAMVGALSWFSWLMVPLMIRGAVLFIPLTRFPAFVWLIAAGAQLSKRVPAASTTAS